MPFARHANASKPRFPPDSEAFPQGDSFSSTLIFLSLVCHGDPQVAIPALPRLMAT